MKTITVRDLRHRWPEAERQLEREGEMLVTRDARPVAKLVRVAAVREPRLRFDPDEHARWQSKTNAAGTTRWVDRALAASRTERRKRPRA